MAEYKATTTSCCGGNHWGYWGPGQCGYGPWGSGTGPNYGPSPWGHNYDSVPWERTGPPPNSDFWGNDPYPWRPGPWINGRPPRY